VLTGLANRRLFHDRLERALAHGERHGSDVAILYLDLDRFKLVNDTLGHPVGDALLRAVAGRLRTAVRATDTVARFGGDEFGVLTAPAPGTAELGEQAARLVTVLSGTYLVEGHTVDVGASVGIAVGRGSVERLEREADIALYRAKRDGRGCWRRFEPTMAKTLRRRRDLETDLRRALPLRQFEVHYQPQLDVTGGAVSGFEALVRWRHPDRGFMGPDAFIPLAEETGLINDIGGWVLTEACREAASWHDPVPIAVNLSPVEFHNPKLVPQVEKALRLSGLPPERLILEITESALLRDSANVSALLQQLQDVGLKIAMDDFGIGYSSLSYLCRFHFDKIKLDKSFIQAIGEDRRAGAIIDAVARLASDLGMTTIAEGVETAGQLRHLEQLGYSAVQGFLIGRPMPATDLAGFLARGAAGVVAADDRRTRATSLTRTSHEHHAPSLALL
jgi:diguanylate cyclase (GGDEF)-like protein